MKALLLAWALGGLMTAVAHAQQPSTEAVERNNRGIGLLKAGKSAEAANEFRAAIDLSPGYAAAQGNLGFAYEKAGQLDDAMAAYQKLLELEPKNATVLNNLATLYSRTGRHDEAIRQYELLLEREPSNETARRNLEAAKRNKTILQERDDETTRVVKAAEARPHDPRAAYDAARVYAQHGDSEQALAWLSKALELGYAQVDFLNVDPAFATLRKDPRFSALVQTSAGTPNTPR
ncbi:MAG TPA: tetratricopeptide repeat protein [Methylomirabilota bacterium]